MSSNAGDFVGPLRQDSIGRDDAELQLARKDLFAQLVPPLVELSLVLLDPFLRHVVRGMRRAGREIHEERLVGHERLLLAHPPDRLVRHVLGEVIAFLRRLLGLDRRGAVVDRRIPLVGLAAEKAVEVLESAAASGPLVHRAERTRFPDRDLVALAELRRRVTIELEGHGERRLVLRQHRGVTWRRRRDLADGAHVHRVMIAACQERLARRRTERGRVEAVELQSVPGQPLGVRRGNGAAKRARGTKPAVVYEDDEHVGRALRRPQRHDRGKLRFGILRVIRCQPDVLRVGNRKN